MDRFMEWVRSLRAERASEPPAPKVNKYERAQAEEWRIPSHRGTEIAVDIALLDVGGFTCDGCRMSFMGEPKVRAVDSKGRTYHCECSACFRIKFDAAKQAIARKGW